VAFSIPQAVEVKGACTLENPVAIASLPSPSGRIDLPARPVFNCRFARQFTEWAGDVVAPIISAHLGSNLASLSTGPGFECRGRNGDTSGKISQHGHGNAVDIDVISLADKRRIAVGQEKPGPEARALKAIRMSGCGYFTTVLGPGSNEAHAAHLHFDLAVRGKNNNYRICE
jgi:hypothetical protein